jgi:hypothetical protein
MEARGHLPAAATPCVAAMPGWRSSRPGRSFSRRVVCGFVLLLIACGPCLARPLSETDLFRLDALLADGVYFGTIVSVKATDASSPYAGNAVFEIRVDTTEGALTLLSADREFERNHPPGPSRWMFLTTDWVTAAGSERHLLLQFPREGIFDADNRTEADVQVAREFAKEASARYLASTECDGKYRRLIGSLAGRNQQAAIDAMYRQRPLTSSQFICLLENLDSDRSLKVGEFKPPWPSQEGTYHHHFAKLGSLVDLLLSQLSGLPLMMSSDFTKEQYKRAWGYWGAVQFRRAGTADR